MAIEHGTSPATTAPERMAINHQQSQGSDDQLLAELLAGRHAHDLTRDQIAALFRLPFPRLIWLAQSIHRQNFRDDEVQLCTLLSVKTGGCKEDCGYCPQSAHHDTDIKAHGMLNTETILAAAQRAKASGSTRFCMGAAWRTPPANSPQFKVLLDAVREVSATGMEVCATLGMLTESQAQQLHEAGVSVYNHNLDTSPEYYGKIISTRTYQDRLDTLANVRKAGMKVCCGGIVGMGEARGDRVGLLHVLHSMNPHPESVPVNMLVRVEGTPLAKAEEFDVMELIRTIAVARIIMPRSHVRLSAGRTAMSDEAQALAFTAGANSIFTGDKLLTTPNPGDVHDLNLLEKLGMRPVAAAESQHHH